MNIIRIVGASLSGIFAFDAFCIGGLSIIPYQSGQIAAPNQEKEVISTFSKLSVSSLRSYGRKCAVSCSNASPIYSNSLSPICKYLARKNAVGSGKSFYKEEEIAVKFDSNRVKELLKEGNKGPGDQNKRSDGDAEKLVKQTREYVNGFFDTPVLNEENVLVGKFTENRINTGSNGWVSSEKSDEFVAKRIFGSAPYSRVSSILGEWERKFRSTVDHGTVKAVVERIKNIDVLSGLLAAAVCDEYEERLKKGSSLNIDKSFVANVYDELSKCISGNNSNCMFALWLESIKREFCGQQVSVQEKKFDLWNRFNAVTMEAFLANFKTAFENEKDSIIKNTLTGLGLYNVGDTLKKRFDSVKGVIDVIDENNEKFASSFGAAASVRVGDVEINLADINVDLSFMEAICAVHVYYNSLLCDSKQSDPKQIDSKPSDPKQSDPKQKIELSSLYSSRLISTFLENRNSPELLYASVLASKIMETFLYQAYYAQQACGQDVRRSLEILNKPLFACYNGLKVSSASYVDKAGLKEVFYTKDDGEIIKAANAYNDALDAKIKERLAKESPALQDKGQQNHDTKHARLEDLEEFISKGTVDKVLYYGSKLTSQGNVKTIFGSGLKGYNGVNNDVTSVDGKKSTQTGYAFGEFLSFKAGSCFSKRSDSPTYTSKACYDDVAIAKAFDYVISGDENSISGKSVEIKDDGFSIAGKIISKNVGGEIHVNGADLEGWQGFLIIREELKDTFAGCLYGKEPIRQTIPGKDKNDWWNKFTTCFLMQRFFSGEEDEKKMENFFTKCKEKFKRKNEALVPVNEGVVSSGEKKELPVLSSELSGKLNEYSEKIAKYNKSMHVKGDLEGDRGGIDLKKVKDVLATYNGGDSNSSNGGDSNSSYAVEDIYLSANLPWFLQQCENISSIISNIDNREFDSAETQIKDLYNNWTNLKWLSAHQSTVRSGLAGVDLSEAKSIGIGSYIERCLDVPVFSATKEWFSQNVEKLSGGLGNDNQNVVVDVLSRMYKDICNFFVNRIAATFLCNIFEGNKDYSSLTETNQDSESLILKSFSSSIIDLIADVYKMKESIDESSSKNIANSSDLLIYAKDCLLDSTTCNKGVVTKLDPKLTYATKPYLEFLENGKYIDVGCLKKVDNVITKPITPMISIDNINFSLQDGVDNDSESSSDDESEQAEKTVVKFSVRNEGAMHPLSFTSLVDFIGGRMNFDQRMILLDSIGIPIEGLFEEFQRVTKSGLLGESPIKIPCTSGHVLTRVGLGGMLNKQVNGETLTEYSRYVYGITENPFFVNENDRGKYGCGSDNVCITSTPLLYSLKSDSFGKTIASSINDVVEKGIFSPKKIQVLLQLLVKSKDIEYVATCNKPVFYYLSFRERELAYGVELGYKSGNAIHLENSPTRNGIYLYKSPYFSPMFSKKRGNKAKRWYNEEYCVRDEYSPFYLNIGDVYSRAVLEDNSTLWSCRSNIEGCPHFIQSGCFRNILGNINFYNNQDAKITGDSVKRLADRFCRGLFNLKTKVLDSTQLNGIMNIGISGKIDGSKEYEDFRLNKFVHEDLKHFSDILLLSGTAMVRDNGYRINNSSVCIMQGMYAPYFCYGGHMLDNEYKSDLNNVGLYKGFFLPAAGMLLSDKMGSFMLENKSSKAGKYLQQSKGYVKSMFSNNNCFYDFGQYFNYGLWTQSIEVGSFGSSTVYKDEFSKNDVLSADWNVHYTNNVKEKQKKLHSILNKKDTSKDLFLFLADNEPKYIIHEIAKLMYFPDGSSLPSGVAISKANGNDGKERVVCYPVGKIDRNMLSNTDKSTELGFFYIDRTVDLCLKEKVLNILKMMRVQNVDVEMKIELYAGLLHSLFAGEWKFNLYNYLKN